MEFSIDCRFVMNRSKLFIGFFSFLSIVFAGVIIFELGMYKSNEYYSKQIAAIKATQVNELNLARTSNTTISATITEKENVITEKENQIQELLTNRNDLTGQITDLNGRIAGLSTNVGNTYPFAVPTTGTIGSNISRYNDNTNNIRHFGVDIWTNLQNGGAISTHKGNPVYSACDGVVESFQPDNGGVTIDCNMISSSFNVPERKVYTYYGHMANAETKEQYVILKYGQNVHRGQFIGYQGDLSMFTPGMRNVHLHFSIFTGGKEREGTQDPCKYIGGSCTEVGNFFVSDIK